jgi:hypothetical protein
MLDKRDKCHSIETRFKFSGIEKETIFLNNKRGKALILSKIVYLVLLWI